MFLQQKRETKVHLFKIEQKIHFIRSEQAPIRSPPIDQKAVTKKQFLFE